MRSDKIHKDMLHVSPLSVSYHMGGYKRPYWLKMMADFKEFFMEELLSGRRAYWPGIGQFQIYRRENKKNPVNWVETLKMWQKHPEKKGVEYAYYTNFATGNTLPSIYFRPSRSRVFPYLYHYQYSGTASFSRKMMEAFKKDYTKFEFTDKNHRFNRLGRLKMPYTYAKIRKRREDSRQGKS